MKNNIRLAIALAIAAFSLLHTVALAQTDTTDTEDYSQFGDEVEVKRFATQKVVNLSPSKLISVGFEMQTSNTMDISLGDRPASGFYRLRSAGGPRIQVNFPVISNDKIIFNLGGQYWGTRFQAEPAGNSRSLEEPVNYLDAYMHHSFGMLASVFKPLNEKNYLIVQLGADYNAARPFEVKPAGDAITVSATAIYGWKPSDRKMWGLGLSRTYRMGRPIVVPVLMWNQTFNDKWGTEIVLPARAFVRRNFSAKSLLLAGYELEGNQFVMPGAIPSTGGGANLFLQRGEIKPRLQYERQLNKFIWMSTQAGVRVNGRFNYTDRYNGKEADEMFRSKLGIPFYFNFSLNLVSP